MSEELPPPGTSVAERALQMVTALTAEVAVLRERVAIFELLSERGGALPERAIDDFQPDKELARRLGEERRALIERVFGALHVQPSEGSRS